MVTTIQSVRQNFSKISQESIKRDQELKQVRDSYLKFRKENISKLGARKLRNTKQFQSLLSAESKSKKARQQLEKVKRQLRELREKEDVARGKGTFKQQKAKAQTKKQIKITKNRLLTLGKKSKKDSLSQVVLKNVDKIIADNNKKLLKKLQRQDIKKRFSDAGLGFVAKVYNEDQLERLERATNISRIPIKKSTSLKGTISQSKDLRFTKKALADLESLRKKAIRGDKNAKASIIGIAALPVAVADVGIDVVQGIVSLVKDPVATLIAISSLRSNDIKDLGVRYGRRISSGDPKALVDIATLIAPIKIPKSEKFIGNLVKQANEIQAGDVIFKFKQNIKKGSGNLKTVTEGITQGNEKIKNVLDLSFQPKTKSIVGTSKTTIGNKTQNKKINLKDEGAFYVDKATKIKIPKTSQGVESFTGRFILDKKQITKVQNQINANVQGKIKFGVIKTKKVKIVGTPKITAQYSQKTINKFESFIGTNRGKAYKDFLSKPKQVKDISTIISKTPKKRTAKQWDKLNKFLEFIQYDKSIINGFDKRTWVGLLLNKNKKTANNVLKSFENDIINGYFVRKGTNTATGSYSILKPAKFRLGPSFALNKPATLKKAKKVNNKVKTPQEIQIPDLESLIYLPSKLPKKVKLSLGLFKVAKEFGIAKQYNFKGLTNKDKLKDLKPIKIPAKKKTKTPLKKQIKTPIKKITKTPAKKQIKTPIKKITKTPKKVVVKTPKAPKVLRVKLPSLDPSKATKGKLGRIKYKVGNKVVRVNTGLPFNKALRVARNAVDNSVKASLTVEAYGKTKKRDIRKPSLTKFTLKVGKNPLVQKLVEKKRHRIDSVGEKSGLKLRKVIKELIKKESKRKKK